MPFFGVCYGPSHFGAYGQGVTESTVDADLQMVAARGFRHIRTYQVEGPNQWNVDKAGKNGLQVGVGIWPVPDHPVVNQRAVDTALQQAQDAAVRYGRDVMLHLVVGNEVNRTDNDTYTPDDIIQVMKYAIRRRPEYPAVKAKITSCFSGTVLTDQGGTKWAPVIQLCEGPVYLTIYPWYGNAAPNNIAPQMDWSWNNGLQQVKDLGKDILIAEIGWPSAGGGTRSSPQNEGVNYGVTKAFLSSNPNSKWLLDTYWFEMFDEPWKTNEGAVGPHWGLCDKDRNPKFNF